MHQRGVFHRDIKPENLMLSRNGVVKICDLGSARLLNNPQPMSEYVSTRWYRAPELLVNHQIYGAEIDVWAIGCIFVELLTGKPLFNGKNELDMLRLILKMFHGSEALPQELKETFNQNNIFSSVKLPEPSQNDFDFSYSLNAKLEGLATNAAISLALECLRLDPKQRPSAATLLNHDYFNGCKDQFEREIQAMVEKDRTDADQ